MMVAEWLGTFLERLAEAFPPHDWPAVGTDEWDVFYEDFRKAFVRNGVSVAEAEDARSLLAENPPRFKADYIPKVVGAVKIVREMNPAAAAEGGNLDDRVSALNASRTCIRCFGEGLAIVYASRPDPEKRIPETTAAYCICPYGQWVEKTHREKSHDVWERIPHLKNVLAGRSFWRLDPIGYEGLSENNVPARGAAALIRAWTAAAAEEKAAAATAARTPDRKPDWIKPVPDDLPMPPPVPREPRPEPKPTPAVDVTEGVEWL